MKLFPLLLFIASLFAACGDVSGDSIGSDTEVLIDSETDETPDAGQVGECDPSAIALLSAELSPFIGTVGIVEWATTIEKVSSATVEFGLDTEYGYTAPVRLSEQRYRTLLLGMKPSSTYHFRVVVNGCPGRDRAITTGSQPTDLPEKTVAMEEDAASEGGFIVASTGMTSGYAYILDADGDYVWWYRFTVDDDRMDGIARAKMSADGRFMWGATINVGCDCGNLFRVSMDGLGEQETVETTYHHDFAVLPDGSITAIEYGDGWDRIVERNALGETRTVYDLNADFAGNSALGSHCNAIHYYPSDDSYTVSCLALNSILKIDRSSGTLLWNLNGDNAGDFTGVSWEMQHGHELLDNGNLLLFSNMGETPVEISDTGAEASARRFAVDSAEVLEISLSKSEGGAETVWRHSDGPMSGVLGDVQRLPGGNTLIAYSSAGMLYEVTPEHGSVRVISVQGLGYADWRPTMYGEPVRY